MSLKVMYLDDEKDLGELFMEMFQMDSVKIKVSDEPVSFVAEVLKEKPDLVFLDFRLPGLSGDEVATEIKAKMDTEVFSKMKVYLITGEMTPKVKFQFKEILAKPIDFARVQEIIDQAVQEKSNRNGKAAA